MRRWIPLILAGGDVLALVLFAFVGKTDHNTINSGDPVGGVLLTAGYFIAPWLVAGALLGAFVDLGEQGRPYNLFTRALNTWLVAAPLGVVLRALAIGEEMIPLPFVLAAMAFGGLFLLVWRLLFWIVWKIGPGRRAAEPEAPPLA